MEPSRPHRLLPDPYVCSAFQHRESGNFVMYTTRGRVGYFIFAFPVAYLIQGDHHWVNTRWFPCEKKDRYHFTLKHIGKKNLMQFHIYFWKSAGSGSLSNGFGCILEFTVPISIELRLQTFSGNFSSFIPNECTDCFQLLKCWPQNEKWLPLS